MSLVIKVTVGYYQRLMLEVKVTITVITDRC